MEGANSITLSGTAEPCVGQTFFGGAALRNDKALQMSFCLLFSAAVKVTKVRIGSRTIFCIVKKTQKT
jgi:hypothetical protein